MSKSCTPKPRYRTTNWSSYNAELKSQGSLTIWLDKHMQWFTAASSKLGHSPKFSDAAIQLCLTIKNLFGLALRQATGFVESLLHLSGLSWPVPDFSTICRRQRNLQVHVPYQTSKAGLHLLVDSTGIKFLGQGEWKCKKHGAERRRQWRKLHIGIDAQTLQIRAICVTSNGVSDAAVLADLLQQVPPNEAVLSLIGDGAYDTQPVYEAAIQKGAIPITPPRKNARIRNAAVAACRRLGRKIWKVWSGYHRRNLVETKMNCIKRLSERVMPRTFERQVNELYIRATILNRFTELGRLQIVAMA